MELGTSLTRNDLQGLVTGWGGVGWTATHDTMQVLGGAAAGWITAITHKPKLAALIALPLVILNAFTASHPILRTFTSLGPGMLAGANAIAVHDWITRGRNKQSHVRAA
jgi:hypothetical protein